MYVFNYLHNSSTINVIKKPHSFYLLCLVPTSGHLLEAYTHQVDNFHLQVSFQYQGHPNFLHLCGGELIICVFLGINSLVFKMYMY